VKYGQIKYWQFIHKELYKILFQSLKVKQLKSNNVFEKTEVIL